MDADGVGVANGMRRGHLQLMTQLGLCERKPRAYQTHVLFLFHLEIPVTQPSDDIPHQNKPTKIDGNWKESEIRIKFGAKCQLRWSAKSNLNVFPLSPARSIGVTDFRFIPKLRTRSCRASSWELPTPDLTPPNRLRSNKI